MFLKTRKSFLQNLLSPAARPFGRTALQAFLRADAATEAAEKAATTEFVAREWKHLQAYSQEEHAAKKQEAVAAEADWLAQLRSPQQKEGIFARIS
jgi:hypothetical protein